MAPTTDPQSPDSGEPEKVKWEPRFREGVHPSVATLLEVGDACVGCSDILNAHVFEASPGYFRLLVVGPDGLYEVTVTRATITEAHGGPG